MNQKTKSLLKALEKTCSLYWNIPPETGQFLNLLIKESNYKNILEIGTSNGYSGTWLAEALKSTKGHLFTIESHKKDRYYLAQKNFKESGLAKYITQILGHAPQAIPMLPRHFDMAFFDATKEEYLSYFNAIKNRIKKGGVIAADNVYSHRNQLQNFLKAIKSDKNWLSYELPLGGGLLLSFKIH